MTEVVSWGQGKPDFSDNVSGDYVNIISGINLQVDISGDPVTISGDHVYVESGAYLASGLHVVADIAESGIGVQIQSGAGVLISGQAVNYGCATKIRTGKVIVVTAASGGQSICVSGYWCSGAVHTLTVKGVSGEIWVGDSGCRPFIGYGFPVADREEIKIDVCNAENVYACAATSGDHAVFIGTDY